MVALFLVPYDLSVAIKDMFLKCPSHTSLLWFARDQNLKLILLMTCKNWHVICDFRYGCLCDIHILPNSLMPFFYIYPFCTSDLNWQFYKIVIKLTKFGIIWSVYLQFYDSVRYLLYAMESSDVRIGSWLASILGSRKVEASIDAFPYIAFRAETGTSMGGYLSRDRIVPRFWALSWGAGLG